MNAEKFMNVVRRHTSFEELTPTLLREFVEKIVVHECSYDENKTRRQDIEIYYSFVGKVDLPEEAWLFWLTGTALWRDSIFRSEGRMANRRFGLIFP